MKESQEDGIALQCGLIVSRRASGVLPLNSLLIIGGLQERMVEEMFAQYAAITSPLHRAPVSSGPGRRGSKALQPWRARPMHVFSRTVKSTKA